MVDNNAKIAILVVMSLLVFMVSLIGHPITAKTDTFSSEPPLCAWSVSTGDKLVGPDALLTVNWTGGDYQIVNNTLEFQKGYAVFDESGIFSNMSEVDQGTNPDHVHKAYLPAGTYYFELSWNDSSDLDAYIYTDESLDPKYLIFTHPNDMASLDKPESTYAYIPGGDYWIVVDWYDGKVPVKYRFFIGSNSYFFHKSSVNGSSQVFNTALVPDNIYRVISTCYDSEGNQYNDTLAYLTIINQFPPEILSVKLNDYDIRTAVELVVVRDTETIIEWETYDPNEADDIFINILYMKPGADSYSILLSFQKITNYTLNWNMSAFSQDGRYRIKIEAYNQNAKSYEVDTAEFELEITSAGNPTSDLFNSFDYSIPSFTLPPLIAALLITGLAVKLRKSEC